jgi:hypothetical protein
VRTIPLHSAVLGAAMLLSACASGGKRSVSNDLESKSVSLTVTNQNWLDVNIFAVRGGSRYRLGAVGGNSSATLRIPAGAMVRGEVQLMADPIGSNDVYVTDLISIAPDEQLQLTVAPRMRMSSYAVWVR